MFSGPFSLAHLQVSFAVELFTPAFQKNIGELSCMVFSCDFFFQHFCNFIAMDGQETTVNGKKLQVFAIILQGRAESLGIGWISLNCCYQNIVDSCKDFWYGQMQQIHQMQQKQQMQWMQQDI